MNGIDLSNLKAVMPEQTKRDLAKSKFGETHPTYGDLVHDTKNNFLGVVLGNCLQDDNKTIWCVGCDENSPQYGMRGYPNVSDLEIKGRIECDVLVATVANFAKDDWAHCRA